MNHDPHPSTRRPGAQSNFAFAGVAVATAVLLTGCAEHMRSAEARDLVQEEVRSVGNELATGVFIHGPDGIDEGLSRANIDRDVDVVVDDQKASLSLWLMKTATSDGSGFGYATSASAVICVEYVVDLDNGDTVIRDGDCPDDAPSGDDIEQDSIGWGHLEIDSHDAMRTLNRFPGPDDRIIEYRRIAPAKDRLPDAVAALQPLTERAEIDPEDVRLALVDADIDGMAGDVLARRSARAVEFAITIEPGGCIFGSVAPGELDVEADGLLTDGGCLEPR